jgi:hypothetical protein
MVEGTTMVTTRAIKLANYRVQHPHTTWKSETYTLPSSALKKISHRDFPNSTDSFESLHTAEGSSTTADNPRATGKQPLFPHKILTRL